MPNRSQVKDDFGSTVVRFGGVAATRRAVLATAIKEKAGTRALLLTLQAVSII